MENKKTVAERLRECIGEERGGCSRIARAVGLYCMDMSSCSYCIDEVLNKIADMIEAEQAELRERVDELNSTFIDTAALDLLADKLECGDSGHRYIAEQIRAAIKPMKRPHEAAADADVDVDVDVDVLPKGVKWPRFEDGELVKFGDEMYIPEDDETGKVDMLFLQQDDFSIRVDAKGLWFWSLHVPYDTPVKRHKPDTLESVVSEMIADWYGDEIIDLPDYIDRLRKLMGGE